VSAPKRLGPLALAVLWGWALAACRPFEDRSPPAPPRARPSLPVYSPPRGFERLRLGVVPFLPAPELLESHRRLASYLGKALGVPVEVQVASSFSDAVDRVVASEYDLVELSAAAYLAASRRTSLSCLVQAIADGSVSTSGYLVVRDDSPLREVRDLRGASVGFVDPLSSIGYLYARKLLEDQGLDLRRDLKRTEFFGDHEAVLLAVRDGRVDVGATFQGGLNALRRSRGVDPLTFRIIAKAPRTPREVLCVREGLPAEVAEAIRRALLALDGRERAGREVLGPLDLNGFQAADLRLYEEVRRVAAALGP
jgi:phosphate/phosphite/phosphonate ABC transporter binding protein